MISKQRQEIVLLTDELTNQCTEIDRLIARNSQLQSKIKVNHKEKCDLENRIKSLLKEVALLQGFLSGF
jgi:predicted RNase H-like nuclease (RuvC/YqgF family)